MDNNSPKVFKVRVTVTESYDSFILVAANSEAEARAYLATNYEWKKDNSLDDDWGGNYCKNFAVQKVEHITHPFEAKEIYEPEYIPWTPLMTAPSYTVGEILERKP